jgi:CBS domain-containing protein
MSNDLVTASPDDTVLVAARRMEDAQVRHLPVLEDGLIAGILSIRDLFTVLVDDAQDPSVVVVRSGTRVMLVGE